MREFLLTITAAVSRPREISFIVGESSTPPPWSEVAQHPAKITRTFRPEQNPQQNPQQNQQQNQRRIYFSATEKFPASDIRYDSNGNAVFTSIRVDLSQVSQAAGSSAEAAYTRAQAPGIMVPGETYYVHAYASGRSVATHAVRLENYPTPGSTFAPQIGGAAPDNRPGGGTVNLTEFIWGMEGWKGTDGQYVPIIEADEIEAKKGEIFFIPLRTRSPDDWDAAQNTVCVTSHPKKFQFQHSLVDRGYQDVITFGEGNTVTANENAVTFEKSAHLFPKVLADKEQDETFDFLYLPKVGTDGWSHYHQAYFECLNGLAPQIFYGGGAFRFRIIEE